MTGGGCRRSVGGASDRPCARRTRAPATGSMTEARDLRIERRMTPAVSSSVTCRSRIRMHHIQDYLPLIQSSGGLSIRSADQTLVTGMSMRLSAARTASASGAS